MKHLFVYGSLKDRNVLEYAIGRPWGGEYEPATLLDFIRVKPSFYMVFERPGVTVDGFLVTGLKTSDLTGLDDFEGVAHGLFRRKSAIVKPANSDSLLTAQVYYNGKDYALEDYIGKELIGVIK